MLRRPSTRTAALLGAAIAVALTGIHGARAEQQTDHKAYKDSKLPECRECHRASGVMDWHSGPNFLREHRVIAVKASSNCGACHLTSYCLDCHNGGNVDTDVRKSLSRRGEAMPTTHAPDFVSIHAMKSRDDPASCQRCHEQKFCNDCHARWQAKSGLPFQVRSHGPVFSASGVLDPTWVAGHRAQAKRDLKSCEACHPGKTSCSNFACHPGLGGR